MSIFLPEQLISKFNQYNYTIHYISNDKNSWVIHVKKYIDIHNFDNLWDCHPENKKSIIIAGNEITLPRYIENYGIDYKFSGVLFKGLQLPTEFEYIVNKLKTLVIHNDKSLLNNCLVNWYEANHYIGPHQDNESQLYKNSPIISFSIGETRKFKLTPIQTGQKLDIMLENSDLLIMGGTCQKTHKYSVPKSVKYNNKRISITMRCFKL